MITVFIFIFSINLSYGSEEELLKESTERYLLSIINKDIDVYKKSVSNKYLKEQEKAGFIKRVFTKKLSNEKKELAFDFKSVKASVTKDKYFINIKEKDKKEFDDEWFIMIKDKSSSKWIIDGIQHMED